MHPTGARKSAVRATMALTGIGIGSNVGDAEGNVRRGIRALRGLGIVRASSRLYRAKAWGVTTQPDFINAAVLLETMLRPRALLAGLKRFENEFGRVPSYRWGPRVIDFDILTYDRIEINEPDLRIPHKHLHDRAFALVPLGEIDPDYAAAAASAPDLESVVPLQEEPSKEPT